MCNIHQKMTYPEMGVRKIFKSLAGKASCPQGENAENNKRVIIFLTQSWHQFCALKNRVYWKTFFSF